MGFTNDRSGEKSRRRWISGHHGEVRIEEQSLVGREPELAALARLIGAAGVGRGRVALMLGEAGIGNTPRRSSQDDGSAVGLRCGVGSLLVDRDAVVLAMETGADQPAGRNRPP
jgi:hypothetical protein